jgi:hypothetical protein
MHRSPSWFGARSAPGTRPRRIPATVLLGLALLAAGAPPASAAGPLPPDGSVNYWDQVALQAVSAGGLSAPDGHILFAYVAIAEYDAVQAIHPSYAPFNAHLHAPSGASAEAAVAAAAHGVLAAYLPAQAATIIDPAYATFVGGISDGQAKTAGVAVGEASAAALVAARAGDGFRAPFTYTPPSPPVPGVWIPTAATPAAGMAAGHMRPFALPRADKFRPKGPPALGSRRWARDFNQTKELGSATSTVRTPEQTTAARFWAEPPVAQARASFRGFISQHALDVVDATRFNAMVSVVYGDAIIACFEAKYHYAFWRPITAIPAGQTDGNARTVGDPGWTPLLAATPNHPEYPSAHSCITPAGGIVISRFLHTGKIDFTIPSLTGLGDRHFNTVSELTRDVQMGRIAGGIHFGSAVRDGAWLARRTTNYILARNFKPIHHSTSHDD